MMFQQRPAVLALVCLLVSASAGHAGADDSTLYGRRLSLPGQMRPELQAAADDLREYLRRVTGADFETTREGVTAGVLLRRADAADVPREAARLLPEGSQEACCLWPDGNDRLWLVARSDLGLCHAVYLYLEQLGCRWYFPSEKWTIVPARKDVRLGKPLALRPAFRSRLFFGTGGFGGKLPLDPERKIEARWLAWQRRNRFGGEFRVSGHTGEAFNLKHQKQLEAHPEWRAMVDGKRVPWSLTAKLCAGNREVVDLYVRDRVDFYRQARQRDPEDPRAWAVSVEPADGGGHCTAPESLALGSVSDRVFHVANEVARAVRKEFPGGHVSLFAYNEHAAVPSIPLEPNVYVQVIPYAFQRTGLTPDQLLDAWSKKVKRMGIYDYWSIPDWSRDLPSFDPLGFGPDRLRGWHRRGVDSFLCESTFSSGAMGPAWLIAARLAWQPDLDVEAVFEEMVRDCFGPAAAPMRRMLRRWAGGFRLTSHELALSFRDVDEAWRLAEGVPEVAARVADYGRYVEYLRRWFDYQQTKRGTDERRAAAGRQMTYLWGVYDTSMIHAFRLSQLLARDEMLAGNPALGQRFDWKDAKAPGWASIRPVADEEVRRLVSQGVRDLKPQDFTTRRFTGPLTRLSSSASTAKPPTFTPDLWPNNTLEADLLVDRAHLTLPLRIASEQPVRLLVSDAEGKQVAEQAIRTGESWRTAWSEPTVMLPAPGLYRVQIVSQKRWFRVAFPGDVPLSLPGWSNSQGTPTPRLYFLAPEGVEQLAIHASYTAAGPPRFFDPTGTEVQPRQVDNGHLLLVLVPPGHRGKVWSLDRAKCPLGPLEMLNAPESFAFSPQTLLVPRDALPRERP